MEHTNPTRKRGRRAFTLVEMLIAMVLTLIMVAAIAEFYAYVGDTVRDGRAMMEISGQMRAAVQRLKSDFDQLTISVVPWADDGAAQGYFEYREGRINLNNNALNAIMATDYDANANDIVDAIEDRDQNKQNDFGELGVTDLIGDMDDYIAFTIRSSGEPFSGRWYDASVSTTKVVTSQLAEVVWFTAFKNLNPATNMTWDVDEPRFLVRRLLLIRPDLSLTLNGKANPFIDNDISAHQVNPANNTWQANTLAELTKRHNRFAHNAINFPNTLEINPFDSTSFQNYILSGDYEGEDVVLSNVLAFDVRVYDPQAMLRQDASASAISNGATAYNALAPPDVGYLEAVVQDHSVVGTGAYVDLGYAMKFYDQLVAQQNNNAQLYIYGNANNPSRLGASMQYFAPEPDTGPGIAAAANPQFRNQYRALIGFTYDTWSVGYERDGFNQDQQVDTNGPTDEGTNGVDDDNANGVDDFNERETRPPYSQPLRGLQVKIRMYEPGTRQMRQATVTTDFIAE